MKRKRNVSLDEDVYEEIRAMARRLRVQPSALVVRAIKIALPKLRKLKGPVPE